MFYDYNRPAKVFWWTVVLLGAIAITHSLHEVASLPGESQAVIALGLVLVGLTSAMPLDFHSIATIFASRAERGQALRADRTRTHRVKYSLADFYSFLLFFAYGVHPATIAYAVDGFVVCRRT